MDGRRDVDGIRALGPLRHGSGELLQEERVALAAREDRGRGAVGHGRACRRRADELHAVLARERRERELRHMGPVGPRGAIPGPVGHEQQHRPAHNALDERAEELIRGAVDPVKVLDEKDQRPPLGKRRHELHDGLERPRPHRVRCHAAEIHRDAEEVQDVGAALRFVGRRPEAALELRLDGGRRIGVEEPAELTDDGRDREVGRRGAVRDASPFRVDGRRRRESVAQLEHQARLADAGLADDAHDVTVAGQGGGEAAAEPVELTTSPDEARHAAVGGKQDPFRAGQPVHRTAIRTSADGDGVEAPSQ